MSIREDLIAAGIIYPLSARPTLPMDEWAWVKAQDHMNEWERERDFKTHELLRMSQDETWYLFFGPEEERHAG